MTRSGEGKESEECVPTVTGRRCDTHGNLPIYSDGRCAEGTRSSVSARPSRKCRGDCSCTCHDTGGGVHDHEGSPCPGKLPRTTETMIYQQRAARDVVLGVGGCGEVDRKHNVICIQAKGHAETCFADADQVQPCSGQEAPTTALDMAEAHVRNALSEYDDRHYLLAALECIEECRQEPRTDNPLPPRPTFEEAWKQKEAEGYQYGPEALEGVRFGWEIRDSYGDPSIVLLKAEIADLSALLARGVELFGDAVPSACAECGAPDAPYLEHRCMLHYGGQTKACPETPSPHDAAAPYLRIVAERPCFSGEEREAAKLLLDRLFAEVKP